MTTSRGWDPFRARLRRLRDDTRADVEAVAGLRAVRRRRADLDELLADLDAQLERSQAAAVITLVGATGAGKSTLLNALAGQPIAEEGVDRPTTTAATIYAPEDADVSELVAVGGESPAPRVVRYATRARGAAAQVFVDAPDMNSVAGEHARVVTALAAHSDVLLVVLHRQSIVEAAPVEFLDGFAERRGLAFLLNRADELAAAAREALVHQIATFARERWNAAEAPVVAVSARRAREQPHGPDRERLLEVVHALVDGQATERIRRHNALGSATMLARLFAEVRDDVAEDLQVVRAEVGRAMAGLAQRVAESGADSWRLAQVHVHQALCAETAQRWDGPGGWVLRIGALDVAGVGAVGLLMRRNPWLAAGLAAGSAAAAGVRRVWAERAGDEVAPLAAGDEASAAYRAALAPARIRLGRLGVEPEALGLPPDAAAATAIAAAVGGSWRNLLERDLPLAAERSGLRYLRLPLDLPVYGLVAWVVWQAGLGLASGVYVGVDFLLNSALVAATYLVGVRWIVSRGLRRRARRLLEVAAARAQDGLDAWHAEVDSELGTALDALTEALERLARLDELWRRGIAGGADGDGLAIVARRAKQARPLTGS